MTNDNQTYSSLTRVGIYSFTAISLWTIWCLLMATWPQIFALPTIRALVRVSILIISAVIFYFKGNREETLLDYFLLRDNWIRGALVGSGAAILYFSIAWLANQNAALNSFSFPIGFSIWFNFIIGSPLAEELFFRGVLLQELRTIIGTTFATIGSSLAFALFHLPQWLILDHLMSMEVFSLFATIFFYGIIFSLFVNLTRSLWGSLLPHWINNFILLIIN